MKKIQSYLLGLLTCVVIAGLIALFICRNRIYVWTLGDVPALYAKAVSHYKAREYQEALPLFEKLAGIDSAAYAKFLLGDMYYRGLGMNSADYKKALELFLESAEQNNTDAHNNLGVMYLSGHGVQADYSKAFRHFQYGAANGNAQAQVGLGTMYRHGWGTARNSSTAFDWYRKAAHRGNVDGMNNLGYMYASGFGRMMSAESALYWYQKAAAKNHPKAMYNIGALYAEGRGVERDLVKCAEWLTKAALLGEATAQFNLGNMYYLGKGVERDLDKAAMWYELAKQQEHRNAARFLKHLEDHQDILELDSNFTIRLIPER